MIKEMDNRKGQSLVEILIAVAVGVILVVGALTIITPTLKTGSDVTRAQTASGLGKELWDNVRSFAERDWHNIDSLPTSSANKYFLAYSVSPFLIATGTEAIVPGLNGYWPFEEGTGSSTADRAGNYTGNITGDVTWGVGQFGNALSFGGGGGKVFASSSETVFKYTGGSMTTAFWLKLDASDDGGALIARHWNQSVYNWLIEWGGNLNPVLFFNIGGASAAGINFGFTTSTAWQHAAVTVASDKTMTLYLNGAFRASSTHAITDWTPSGGDANAPLTIGCYFNQINCTSVKSFKGLIDDVRVYNRILNADEIKSIYTSTSSMAFTRYFYLEDAYRNGSGKIDTAGTRDPSTRKLNVVYTWPPAASGTFSGYITRVHNESYVQTDWSAGGNQDGPITATSVNSRFATSSGISNTTSTGAIVIQGF